MRRWIMSNMMVDRTRSNRGKREEEKSEEILEMRFGTLEVS